jgi:hypothetical protein
MSFLLRTACLGLALLAGCGGKQTSTADTPDAGPSQDVASSPTDVVTPMPDEGPIPCLAQIGAGGTYYMSCRPRDLPVEFAFAVQQTVMSSADWTSGTLDMVLTPLRVGAGSLMDAVQSGTFEVPTTTLESDCTFTQKIGSMTLPAEANPLTRDLRIENAVLRGKLLASEPSCGELDGMVPLIMLSLENDGDVCVWRPVLSPTAPLPAVADSDYVCPPGVLPPR